MAENKKLYYGKLVKNGNALQITVPLNLRKELDLKSGDVLKVEISVETDASGNPKNAVFWIKSGNLK